MSNFLTKYASILSLVLASFMVFGALCTLLGQTGTGIISFGFLSYVINVFASPLLILFPSFLTWANSITSIFIVVSIFLVIGILAMVASILNLKGHKFYIFEYVCSILMLAVASLSIYSMCVFGLEIVTGDVIWSAIVLFAFLLAVILNFALQTYNLAKGKQRKVNAKLLKNQKVE